MNSHFDWLRGDWLSSTVLPDPIHVGAFFRGCATVDASLARAIRSAGSDPGSPSGADIFTRAQLRSSDQGISQIVRALEIELRRDTAPTSDFERAGAGLLGAVAGAITSGRAAVLLGEPTIFWLANFINGHSHALARLAPQSQHEREVERFLASVASQHGVDRADWWVPLRVLGGAADRGLQMFAELWATHSVVAGPIAPAQ